MNSKKELTLHEKLYFVICSHYVIFFTHVHKRMRVGKNEIRFLDKNVTLLKIRIS